MGKQKVRQSDSRLLTPPGVSIEDLDPLLREQSKLICDLLKMASRHRYNIKIFKYGVKNSRLKVKLSFKPPVDMYVFLRFMNRASFTDMRKEILGGKLSLYMTFYSFDLCGCQTEEDERNKKFIRELKDYMA